jgi:asparagine synthase (glutamine-hydrolysing)
VGGCALLAPRGGEQLAPGLLEVVMDGLGGSGVDGRDVRWSPHAALGHLHFWTTPEEVGERQPLRDPESGLELIFDGRLDNRSELAGRLGLDPGEGASLSDAALALRAFAAWGRDCFARFLGPFVMLVVDSRAGRVVCARDALGDRTLYYHRSPGLLAVASEESALLGLPMVSDAVDELSVARFLAALPPATGSTFFASIRELPPAGVLTMDGDRVTVTRYWRAEDVPPVRHRRDEEWIEHFAGTLADSVACRLRTVGRPVVQMSGGLDSTAVAALASRQLDAAGSAGPLATVSWVFDELEGADEREFIEPMAEAFGLDAHLITGDDAWPLADPASWPVSPNAPMQGLYRRLTEATYASCRDLSARTLIGGHFGDQLYTRWPDWLRDLLHEGRLAEAWHGVTAVLAARGPGRRERLAGLARAAARVTGLRRRRFPERPWLTAHGQALVAASEEHEPTRRRHSIVDPMSAQAASREAAFAARVGIDLRRPYRDRRLVELMLSMPAHLVYRRQWPKWVLRKAMGGLLPEAVRLRTRRSSLAPLAVRGLVEREQSTASELLQRSQASWLPYVRRDWLEGHGQKALRADGVEAVVAWSCICLELWQDVTEWIEHAPETDGRSAGLRPTVGSSE